MDIPELDGTLEVGRGPGARLGAVAGAILAACLAASALTVHSGLLGGIALLVLAAAVFGMLSAFGDRFRIGPDALDDRNRLWPRAPFRPRRLAFREIESMRVLRGRMIVLVPREGPRLVLDAIEREEEVAARIAGRSGLAAPEA